MVKAVKFGGSSLAGSTQFQKVKNIILADTSRRFVVPSAPGKRFRQDTKVTDLLYTCYHLISTGADAEKVEEQIESRYAEIVKGLHLTFDYQKELRRIYKNIQDGYGMEYAASRGEYLNGLVMAEYLDFPFIDAAEVILFDKSGNFLPEETYKSMKKRLSGLEHAVIPGFYGSMPDGTVKTFSRGGSDITGALVAQAVSADMYENWTDVSGFLLADPRIVDDPVSIGTITYKELHELSRMGASVLHEDAIFPVKEAGIPIHIKNTDRPDDIGTCIVSSTWQRPDYEITGIAGKKGYSAIHLRKNPLHTVESFDKQVKNILAEKNIPCEEIPSAADTLSILVPQREFLEKEHAVLTKILHVVHPDSIFLESDLALIAVGGRGFRSKNEIVGNVFSALGDAHIHIRTMDRGMANLAMVIGVYDRDFESTVRVIYNKFIKKEYGKTLILRA